MVTSKEVKKNNHLFWETQEDNIFCQRKKKSINSEITYLHCHDGYEILIIENGHIDMQIEDKFFEFTTGDVVLIPPYVFHFARQQHEYDYHRVVINIKESTLLSLVYKDKIYQQFSDIFYKTTNYRLPVSKQTLSQLISLSIHLQRATEDNSMNSDNSILSFSLLSIILVILNRVSNNSKMSPMATSVEQNLPDVIKSVFKYIDDNFNTKIAITDIASSVHLNSVYLTRLFHQYTGLSIQQYIIEKRLSKAKQLLKKGLSPTDVCFECGFNNYSNFSRTFTNHVKVSPRQFQENSRAYFEALRN